MNSYLVVYDVAAGRLLQLDEYADPNDAAEARLKREIELSERSGLEIVVLAAESQLALRRTHARYFNTVGQLARTASTRSVTPSSDGAWEVRAPGGNAAVARGSQSEMIERGRAMLRASGGGELRVHGRDGRIRQKDTVVAKAAAKTAKTAKAAAKKAAKAKGRRSAR